MTFDLEKARAEVDTASSRRFSESREQARIFCAEEILPDALDEIERLRAEIKKEKETLSDYWKVHDEQAKEIQRLTEKCVINDARTTELADALVDEQTKVIMLIEKLQLVANDPDWQSKGLKHDFYWYMAESKKEIESGEPEDQRCRRLEEPNWGTDPKGKIGPDEDAKPHCWQITEERKAAIRDAEIALRDAVLDSNDPHCWDAETAVLRAMLTDAGQE